MRLEIIVAFQYLIIAFISYMITIPFAGWFEALIAKAVGDQAPEDAGFLTLNPLEHFNVFGFAALLWSIFFTNMLPFQFIPGWGRHIPLIPDNIRGKYYKLRIFIEYIGRSCGHLIVLTTAAICMMLVCGVEHVYGFVPMISDQTPTFQETLARLLFFICEQNLVLFIIHAILGGFKYLIYFYMPKMQEISFVTVIGAFIALLIGLSVFGPLLQIFVFKMLAGLQILFLMLLGK
ncbi:MAG: hypothetical protein ACXWL2_00885 [Candidatus Chromulinivorax sp.]